MIILSFVLCRDFSWVLLLFLVLFPPLVRNHDYYLRSLTRFYMPFRNIVPVTLVSTASVLASTYGGEPGSNQDTHGDIINQAIDSAFSGLALRNRGQVTMASVSEPMTGDVVPADDACRPRSPISDSAQCENMDVPLEAPVPIISDSQSQPLQDTCHRNGASTRWVSIYITLGFCSLAFAA